MHECTHRLGLQRVGKVHLFDPARTQYGDAIRDLHRLGLVVCDENVGQTIRSCSPRSDMRKFL